VHSGDKVLLALSERRLALSTISLICVMLEFARGESSGATLEHRLVPADRQDQPIEMLRRRPRVVPPEALAPVLTDFIAVN
jgi:hypothetical protein